jgi:hypothetical protein
MKRKHISRNHEQLTSEEKGVLAFKLMAARDESALMELSTTIPRFNYRSPDIQFSGCLGRMIDAAMYWGMTHWRLRHSVMASCYLQSQGEETPHTPFYWNQHLLALDLVLEELNISHGLSPETVRNTSGAEPVLEDIEMTASLLFEEDAREFHEYMREVLVAIIEGKEAPLYDERKVSLKQSP